MDRKILCLTVLLSLSFSPFGYWLGQIGKEKVLRELNLERDRNVLLTRENENLTQAIKALKKEISSLLWQRNMLMKRTEELQWKIKDLMQKINDLQSQIEQFNVQSTNFAKVEIWFQTSSLPVEIDNITIYADDLKILALEEGWQSSTVYYMSGDEYIVRFATLYVPITDGEATVKICFWRLLNSTETFDLLGLTVWHQETITGDTGIIVPLEEEP